MFEFFGVPLLRHYGVYHTVHVVHRLGDVRFFWCAFYYGTTVCTVLSSGAYAR